MSNPLFGIINVNKSRFVTSRGAVNAIKKFVKPTKLGHAGTLDPMATGVLLICIGKATRLVTRIQDQPKVYRAKFVFGRTSDTDDATGTIQSTGEPPPNVARVEAALGEFTGEIRQVPPAFSAVHVDGKRAYKLARRGVDVELKPKVVRVDRFELIGHGDDEFEFEIECGSGTYIRSLARDLGERLGCGGLMSALERTRIGVFTIENGLQIGGGEDPRQELTREQVKDALQSPLAAMPNAHVQRCESAEDERQVRLGRPIAMDPSTPVGSVTEVAIESQKARLLAIADIVPGSRTLKPKLVFDALQ